MARYVHIDNQNALDTQTNERRRVLTLPVEYIHLRNNRLVTVGCISLTFTPAIRLPDIHDRPSTSNQELQQLRRLVIEERQPEGGRFFSLVVAVQTVEGADEYVDCITDQDT